VTARLRLVMSEAWSSVTANVSTTFAALMTVLIGMLLLGVFLALGTWVLSWGHHLKSQLQVRVFITDTATPTQRNDILQHLRSDPLVKPGGIRFVSKAEALRIMQKRNPDLTQNLPGNPLPAGWYVTPRRGEDAQALYREWRASTLPGLEDVTWPGKTGRRVLTVAKVISLIFLIAVILLIGAATLLIANTIRLSIFARRREVEVMKLVGASNWFIRGPFMLEGLLTGLAGSLVAVVLLVLGKEIALPAILPHIDGSNPDVHALPFALNALCMVGAGLLLGAAGSGLTLRRFLQV
jgi:cell division transport system permease protein